MSDIDDIFQTELKDRRAQNIFAPPENLITPADIPTEKCKHLPNISFDETTEEALLNAEYGPQQVEFLLNLLVDYPLRKKMGDALDDADAISHLNKLKK